MHALALDVHYGDKITLKHKDTKVFLHSHTHRYPLRYDDGRVSSAGQQVTGYPHKDQNNVWQIQTASGLDEEELSGPPKRQYTENEKVVDKRRLVKHKDVVRLYHIETDSFLLTHDVASPSMPTNQEFTTWPSKDLSRFNDTLFAVEIDDGKANQTVQSSADYLRLVHVPTRVALWTHAKALPEWAFKQQEINGNKNIKDGTTRWIVDEVMGVNATKIKQIEKKKTKEPPHHVSFLSKFLELQGLMISHNAGLTKPHPYASHPIAWPLLVRGISFWTQSDSKRQIYLLGNPFGWWVADFAAIALLSIVTGDFVGQRRGVDLIGPVYRNRLYMSGGFIFVGWVLHYFPFFLMGRMLFLHHYLPALILGYMLGSVLFQFAFVHGIEHPVSLGQPNRAVLVHKCRSGQTAIVAACILIACQFACFLFFAPITYGSPGLDVNGVLARKWLPSWDYHFAK